MLTSKIRGEHFFVSADLLNLMTLRARPHALRGGAFCVFQAKPDVFSPKTPVGQGLFLCRKAVFSVFMKMPAQILTGL